MLKYIQDFAIDFILTKIENNYLIRIKRYLLTLKADVIFVSEGKNWAIEWVGRQIKQNLNKLGFINFEIGFPSSQEKNSFIFCQ